MSKNVLLKISVVKSKIEKLEILQELERKFHKFHDVKINFIKEGDPYLELIYNDEEHMEKNFNRDLAFYESTINLLVDQNFKKKEKILNTSGEQENQESKGEDDPYESMYLILKYETAQINVLREYYNFIFHISTLLDISYAYEEIDNGFLIFHENEEDFQLSLLDLLNKEEIFIFLKERGQMTKYREKILENIFSRMSKLK